MVTFNFVMGVMSNFFMKQAIEGMGPSRFKTGTRIYEIGMFGAATLTYTVEVYFFLQSLKPQGYKATPKGAFKWWHDKCLK